MPLQPEPLLFGIKRRLMNHRTSQRPRVYGAIVPWLLFAALAGAASIDKLYAEALPPLTPAEREYLNRKGAVTYCLDPDRLPFSAIRNGRPQGMAVDVVGRIQAQLGIPFQFVPTETWPMSLEYIESGGCDILPMVDIDPFRHPYLHYTAPYFQYAAAIVTQIHAPFITGIRELRDRTIGIGENDPMGAFVVDKLSRIPFTVVNNARDGLLKVSSGDLDALVAATPVAVYYIRRLGLTNLKVAGHVDILKEMGIGVRAASPVLHSILNKVVSVLSEAEVERIYRKQIAVQPDRRIDYGRLLQLLLGVCIAVGLLLIWHRNVGRLKKRAAKVEAALAAKDEQMKQMAITDPLTCLSNRMRLIDILTKEMHRFSRYGRPASIIVADVDHFKDINEAFGYNLGDVVICKIGKALSGAVRKADTCGRWGGEK